MLALHLFCWKLKPPLRAPTCGERKKQSSNALQRRNLGTRFLPISHPTTRVLERCCQICSGLETVPYYLLYPTTSSSTAVINCTQLSVQHSFLTTATRNGFSMGLNSSSFSNWAGSWNRGTLSAILARFRKALREDLIEF